MGGLADALLGFEHAGADDGHEAFVAVEGALEGGEALAGVLRKPAVVPGVSVTQAVREPIRRVAALSKPLTQAVGRAVKCMPCL